MNKIVYLSCPYTHKQKHIREWRYKQANKKTIELINSGFVVFSPITHRHHLALSGKLEINWTFWEKYDRAFIDSCKEMYVLCLYGWENSEEVQAEIAYAESLNLPITYLT